MPKIPEKLEALKKIAYNIWWTWNNQAVDLFRWIDSELWETCCHNPVKLLGHVSQERLEELAGDAAYLSLLERTMESLEDYLERSTWFDSRRKRYGLEKEDFLLATFSAEFGLHESIPVYSGGLGILAGDTLKSCSELGLPAVGVSLLYRYGYFSQYLSSDGWQQERYFVNDYSNMPVNPVYNGNGEYVTVEIPLADRIVKASVWEVKVGRVSLFLLDTNLPGNATEDREITGQLYGGDREMRIKQEIILGIGGLKILDAMGMRPTVRHINEGHSAFLIIERIRQLMEEGLSFPEAREMTVAGNVFTTHTPVPAGNEEFLPDLVAKYLAPLIRAIGLSREEFLAFGKYNDNPNFSMTVFGLRLSRYRNGVSKLHGEISREIWKDVWPGLPAADTPIDHVTNGIHPETWISDEMDKLLGRYVGPRWSGNGTDSSDWEKVEKIPDSELWPAHTRMRERLVSWAREKWRKQVTRMGLLKPCLEEAPILDPDILTIGAARRFATYKRATLLLRDRERLSKLVNHPTRPVQFIMAGKAHPHDSAGKEMIREIVHLCLEDEFYGKVIFLEDYDMNMAKHLIRGVDVWLNTPRLPMEACGTSGMKACFNGVLHCSVPDGWWAEAYRPGMGWSIGSGEKYDDPLLQDRLEAKALYDIIENRIVPLFYERNGNDIPFNWLKMARASMRTVCPVFSSNRMLAEYVEKFYVPACRYSARLAADGYGGARELAAWMEKMRNSWNSVRIRMVDSRISDDTCSVGDLIPVTVGVEAPGLEPDDLLVEVLYGRMEPDDRITHRKSTRLEYRGEENGLMLFSGSFHCDHSGMQGFTVRILPHHRIFGRIIEPGMVCWWE